MVPLRARKDLDENKPVRLTSRGYKVILIWLCTSACYRPFTSWMEGFKCRKLNRSGGGIEIIFPIDFGIYLSVITPLSINTQSTGFHTAQAYTQSNDGFV